jgi:hypothetical protein
VLHLFHAIAEGRRQLEKVCTWMVSQDSSIDMKRLPRKLAAIDFLGAALTLAGSTLIIVSRQATAAKVPRALLTFIRTMKLGLTWAGSEHPWDSGYVIGTIVAGGAVWILFILWQWKGTALPLMPCTLSFPSAIRRQN